MHLFRSLVVSTGLSKLCRPVTYISKTRRTRHSANTEVSVKMARAASNLHCCVPLCKSDSRYESSVSFHAFPKDAEIRKQWIIAIRRDEGPLFKLLVSPEIPQSQGFMDNNIFIGMSTTFRSIFFLLHQNEIVKAYRKMARKWHPDMHKGQKAKEEASGMFQKIANAYEILRDEEQRADYDYMLDNPDEYYSIYFNYYKHRMAPRVDIRIVIGITITVISVIQYWGAWNNYNTAVTYLCKDPKYRSKAVHIAKSEGNLYPNNKKKKGKTKEELKEEEEVIIRKVIEENMDIRGGYGRPSFKDVLWIQLLFLPYTVIRYIFWWCLWIWKFTILRQEYGEEEKQYLIRRYMKLNQYQWDMIEDDEKENFLESELWKIERFEEWKEKQEDERKSKLAESARYKSYRRYMKKGGAGQMTFGPE